MEVRVRGTEAEKPSETAVSRGSMVRWAIADRERVKIGLRRGEKGRVLGGAIVAKVDSSEEDDRE